jgi:hypothetical protein
MHCEEHGEEHREEQHETAIDHFDGRDLEIRLALFLLAADFALWAGTTFAPPEIAH